MKLEELQANKNSLISLKFNEFFNNLNYTYEPKGQRPTPCEKNLKIGSVINKSLRHECQMTSKIQKS